MSAKDLKMWNVDKSWTLFLDRDGTINKLLPGDYVKTWQEFEFLPGVLEAIPLLNSMFGIVVIATNQQGVGKGLMNEDDLWHVHHKMLDEIHLNGGIIHEIYHCPELAELDPPCRKPNPGMGFEAKKDFSEINFKKSVMVGDSLSDMEFGRSLKMKTVFLDTKPTVMGVESPLIDLNVANLADLAKKLIALY
jgi:histidinol-phosphate phosphatase family protein